MLRNRWSKRPEEGSYPRPHPWVALFLFTLALQGCSIKGMAMNSLADALSGQGDGGSVYLSDDDPILVGEALPFSLKSMESILQATPEHDGLLVAAASGFVSYSEMWVYRPARYLEDTNLQASRRESARAKALFLRGREYAGRALNVRHPGVVPKLLRFPDSTVGVMETKDIPAMYWFAAAHGRAISLDPSDAELLVQATAVTALLDRALELDESWNKGALHELYMSIPTQLGGSPENSETHFVRAMELNGGASVGPLVSLAESVHLARQDRDAFTRTLQEVLAFDPDQYPENRLTNILAQEHATWLLSKADELFWVAPAPDPKHPHPNRRRFP
jgi:hypothetical protein